MFKSKKSTDLRKDNNGIALASVLVIVTVCMLVATIVLELTYTSLLSRKVNKNSSDNFYSSEYAINDLETILQDVAVYTMNQMSTSSTAEFIETAKNTILKSAGATSVNDTDKISEYLFSQLSPDNKKILGKESTPGTYVYDSTKFKVKTVLTKASSTVSTKSTLVFNVELNYQDPKTGFLSTITTDLVMNDVTHRTPAASYSLGSYSMFTGGGANFMGNGDRTNGSYSCFLQEGNAYIGMMMEEAPKALTVKGCSVVFDGNRIIINGDVYVDDGALIFSGDKITKDGKDEMTQVDIRGTLYIGKDAVVNVGTGVDLMVQDIVLVDGSTKTSVFTDGKSFLNNGKSTYNSLYPYTVTEASKLKGLSLATHVPEWKPDSRKTSGCIMAYDKDAGTSKVLEYKNNKWVYAGTDTEFTGLINHSQFFMPEAMATVWCYDGSVHNIDAEMANFINMDTLYWQYKNGNGGAIDYSKVHSMKNIATGKLERTNLSISNPAGYTFKDAGVFNGLTTSTLYSKLNNLPSYDTKYTNLVSGRKILGKALTGAVIFVGSNGGFVVNDSVGNNCLSLTTAWSSYTLGLNTGSFVGLNLSASKVNFQANGKGVVTSYSMHGAKKEEITPLVNDLKYLTYWDSSALDVNGNGKSWYNLTNPVGTYDNFYALGSIDSLYKGGLDAFFDENGSNTAGGEITVDSSNMYNFITVENWQIGPSES